jgi:hypothetical protein
MCGRVRSGLEVCRNRETRIGSSSFRRHWYLCLDRERYIWSILQQLDRQQRQRPRTYYLWIFTSCVVVQHYGHVREHLQTSLHKFLRD